MHAPTAFATALLLAPLGLPAQEIVALYEFGNTLASTDSSAS